MRESSELQWIGGRCNRQGSIKELPRPPPRTTISAAITNTVLILFVIIIVTTPITASVLQYKSKRCSSSR